MKLHKPGMGAPPRRKTKTKPNPFEHYPEYLALVSGIANNKMKPQETWGMYLDAEDAAKLGMKHPWRALTESLMRFVRDRGLEADYRIVKYATNTPGQWFVSVTYEPPITVARR